MGKTKAVKWAIGADEPDDLNEFLSNDDLVLKHTPKKGPNKGETEWPGKGPFRFKVVQMKVKPNKNGDDRISAMLVLDESKDSEAVGWNGYCIFDGFNVVEGPGLSFLKRYLKALGLSWSDFRDKSKQNDEDPPQLVQIAGTKFGAAASKPVHLKATVVVKPADDFNDDEHLEIKQYIPLDDGSEGDEDDDEPDEAVDVLDDDADADEDEADDEEDAEDDDASDDDDPWTREDLEDEDFDTVAEVAKDDFGLKAKDLKAFKKDEDVEGLLDLMFPPDDDEDEDEDEEDEDDEDGPDEDEIAELREELNGLKIAALRKRALKNDEDADVTDLKKQGLVDLILQQELNLPPF